VTRDPKALKIEATCTPVAPAPTTKRVGRRFEAPGVAVGGGQLEAGQGELPRHAAGAHDDVRGSQWGSVVSLDYVWGHEAGSSGVFVEGHARLLELVA
jgi:hypothetical protein